MAFVSRKVGVALVALALIILTLLTFIKMDLDVRDAYLCQAFHSTPGLDPTQCPVHKSHTSWYFVFAYIASALILVAGGVGILAPTSILSAADSKPETKVDIHKLSEEEQKVYTLLTEKEGSMYQSDLTKETGFSKVQTTRILDKMEAQKILERKRRGMTNIVILK